jgi:hypothetical protein
MYCQKLHEESYAGHEFQPDRPEVEKNINDLQSNLGTVADKFEKRSKDLEVALTKAVHFQDELMVNETSFNA